MVSYCWVLTQHRGGRYHMVRQKPAAFSLSSLNYQFLDLTKKYLILHFCSFCIPSPFSFSLLFFSSLPPPSLSPSQSVCECGPTWDTVHLWRSEHNFQEFNLSFHHGSLGINLKSSGLHSKSFSCWVCLPLLEKPWTPWQGPYLAWLNPNYTPDTRLSNGNFLHVDFQWMHTTCFWFSLNRIQTFFCVCAWYYDTKTHNFLT